MSKKKSKNNKKNYIQMQRNKFLEDLGIKLEYYGTNFAAGKNRDVKHWKKQQKKYGFDSRECYNLDRIFVEWLYSHIRMYMKDADGFIDLDWEPQSVEFGGKKYTQREAINCIIKACEEYLKEHEIFGVEEEQEVLRNMQDAIRLWAEIFPAMWW